MCVCVCVCVSVRARVSDSTCRDEAVAKPKLHQHITREVRVEGSHVQERPLVHATERRYHSEKLSLYTGCERQPSLRVDGEMPCGGRRARVRAHTHNSATHHSGHTEDEVEKDEGRCCLLKAGELHGLPTVLHFGVSAQVHKVVCGVIRACVHVCVRARMCVRVIEICFCLREFHMQPSASHNFLAGVTYLTRTPRPHSFYQSPLLHDSGPTHGKR